jgi:hypothetical protein
MFATLLLQDSNNKVDLRTLQELLGHESLASTSIYTHVDFEQKKKAINSFIIPTVQAIKKIKTSIITNVIIKPIISPLQYFLF